MICTYQDHAEEEEMETSSLSEKITEPESAEQIIFPVKLHNMLNQVEKQGLADVVGWAPHGRCFLVRSKEAFASRILSRWFRQSKFASFQRQLNLYGFKRITTGPDKGGYYHELFLRSKIFLCHRIERVKIKGSKPGRIKAYADAEPDFYKMRDMPDDGRQAQAAATGPRADPPNPRFASRSSDPLHLAAGLSHPGGFGPAQGILMPPEFGQLAFLAGQPHPMSMARASPTQNDACGIPKDDTTFPPLFDSVNLNTLLQPNAASFPNVGAERKEDDNFAGRAQFRGILPGGSLSSMHSSANASISLGQVYPSLDASGGRNLAHLGEAGAGIFLGQQFGQQFPQPYAPTLAKPSLGPAGGDMSQLQLQQPQHLQLQQPPHLQLQQPQQLQLPRHHSFSLDMMDMPSDLPTAQSLAIENIFEQEARASTLAAATAAITGTRVQQSFGLPNLEAQSQPHYEQLLLPDYPAVNQSFHFETLTAAEPCTASPQSSKTDPPAHSTTAADQISGQNRVDPPGDDFAPYSELAS